MIAGSQQLRGISTLQSFWFIKSDHLGKLCVGLAVAGFGQHRHPG